jgi:hypothetical protein
MMADSALNQDFDRHRDLLKWHLPYHESDQVLNITFKILAGGHRIERLCGHRVAVPGIPRLPTLATSGMMYAEPK